MIPILRRRSEGGWSNFLLRIYRSKLGDGLCSCSRDGLLSFSLDVHDFRGPCSSKHLIASGHADRHTAGSGSRRRWNREAKSTRLRACVCTYIRRRKSPSDSLSINAKELVACSQSLAYRSTRPRAHITTRWATVVQAFPSPPPPFCCTSETRILAWGRGRRSLVCPAGCRTDLRERDASSTNGFPAEWGRLPTRPLAPPLWLRLHGRALSTYELEDWPQSTEVPFKSSALAWTLGICMTGSTTCGF